MLKAADPETERASPRPKGSLNTNLPVALPRDATLRPDVPPSNRSIVPGEVTVTEWSTPEEDATCAVPDPEYCEATSGRCANDLRVGCVAAVGLAPTTSWL